MAPVTIAGALAQQNAEALAGIALTQLVRPGAPVVYGGFTSNVDMKSGAPAFGTPEYMKAVLVGGQLCRKYGIPITSSTVLTHAEVEPTLGIKQAGKWDIAWLPGMNAPADPLAVGNVLRALIRNA
jgi:trimethylamine:corrinoid methyltransferase-like protein